MTQKEFNKIVVITNQLYKLKQQNNWKIITTTSVSICVHAK